MFEQNYPTPTTLPSPLPSSSSSSTVDFEKWKRDDGWVEAPYVPLEEGNLRRVLGLDCEMVSFDILSLSSSRFSNQLIVWDLRDN